jgi:hypothetical protein
MALQIKLSTKEFKRSFAIFDETGDYSKDNPGGWGGPNPRRQDVDSSIVQIQGPQLPLAPNFDPQNAILNPAPGSQPYVIPQPNGLPVPTLTPLYANLQLVGNFPNLKHYGYEILPNMVGSVQNNKIISGLWTFQWIVNGITLQNTAFQSQRMLIDVFMNDVTCCVDKQTDKLNKHSFEDNKSRAIIELGVLLESACKSKKCGKYNEADETIRFLNGQCVCVTC